MYGSNAVKTLRERRPLPPERVPLDAVQQIANAAFERLGDVLVAMPVDVPGRVRQMLHGRG